MLPSLAFVALTAVGLHAAKPSKSAKPAPSPTATAPVAPAAQPAAPATPARKFVAVAPLASTSISRGEADLIGEALSTAIQRRSGARMMERSQMEKILQEQGFQNSGACDKSDCAIQIGKILGIDQIVVGSVGKLGDSYMLNARLVDIATGEILGSTSRTAPARIEQVVNELPKAADDLFAANGTAASAPATPPAPQQTLGTTNSGSNEETYSSETKFDDPLDTRFLLRGNIALGCFYPTSLFSLDYAIEADLRVAKRLWLNVAYNQEFYGIYNPKKVSMYTPYTASSNSSYDDLPNATPGGDKSLSMLSFGGTWMVSQSIVKEPQSQIFDTRQIFSEQIGNTQFTAYHSKYLDVPVTYEQSVGLRGGLMLESHPFFADDGNGGYLEGHGQTKIRLDGHVSQVQHPDTTTGWTNERNLIAYLGVSREYRQGSLVEITRNENGQKFPVSKFFHSVGYLDLLLDVASGADDVDYAGKSYAIEQGSDPGQIPTRMFGFRAGYVVQSGATLGVPYSGEFGWLPGSGSIYFKVDIGLGLRV